MDCAGVASSMGCAKYAAMDATLSYGVESEAAAGFGCTHTSLGQLAANLGIWDGNRLGSDVCSRPDVFTSSNRISLLPILGLTACHSS